MKFISKSLFTELQKLKAQVVTEIRGNQQLESDLNVMDIKIGLLVRNRLELQDVVNHGRRLKRRRRDVSQLSLHGKGLKTLDKESRQRLEVRLLGWYGVGNWIIDHVGCCFIILVAVVQCVSC